MSSIEDEPKLELNRLLPYLKFAYLGENDTLFIILSTGLTNVQLGQTLIVLK